VSDLAKLEKRERWLSLLVMACAAVWFLALGSSVLKSLGPSPQRYGTEIIVGLLSAMSWAVSMGLHRQSFIKLGEAKGGDPKVLASEWTERYARNSEN
jgi:hypothetical protein